MNEGPIAQAQELWTQARKLVIERNPNLTTRQTSVIMSIRPTMAMDNFVVLSVTNTSSRDIIENQLDQPIREALSHAAGMPMTYAIRVKAENTAPAAPTTSTTPTPTAPSSTSAPSMTASSPVEPIQQPARPRSRSRFIQPELRAEEQAEIRAERADQQTGIPQPAAQPEQTRAAGPAEVPFRPLPPQSSQLPLSPALQQDQVQLSEEQAQLKQVQAQQARRAQEERNHQAQMTPATGAAQSQLSQSAQPAQTPAMPTLHGGDTLPSTPLTMPRGVRRDPETQLNPDDTFDNFVPGQNSRFARAAALSVAEQPGYSFNPLFIWGDSGLGKTHLLNAIGNYSLSLWPKLKIRYVSSEQFTNEFIEAVQNSSGSNGSVKAFNHRYRDVDMLLIDDIQFLGGKIGTLEAFFHTFNALYSGHKQIVIASDVQPRDLKGFDERITSRFDMGLTVDVQPPDQETRIAILRMKLQNSTTKLSVPDEVLQLIAQKVTDNIRELEGALTRVLAMASLNNQPVTMELAEQTLRDYFIQSVEVTPTDIITRTASYFDLEFNDLVGAKRAHKIATARQIAMYLCREMTGLSLSSIGEIFGGRDHTTVIHAYQKISNEMAQKREIYNNVTDLSTQLKQGQQQTVSSSAPASSAKQDASLSSLDDGSQTQSLDQIDMNAASAASRGARSTSARRSSRNKAKRNSTR
jgi:chromosomal replication initiator protein